jgi:ectoine hydroxylase-related dioxygenase (phytanoyl-CoA dioxygenase family)
MTTHEGGHEPQAVATLERLPGASSVDDLCAVLERDGAVIVEDLLSPEVVAAINSEVEATVRETDPEADWFNEVMKEFHGPNTRAISGVPGISPTFAVEAMCHPLLLGVCDRVLLPSCARYQLNLGQILQRGPGSPDQILHRDEVVWADVPRPAPELQLATVIAFVDFTVENGATRVVPGSHRWDDRTLVPIEQILRPPPEPHAVAHAVMSAGSAVVYLGGTIHGAGANVTTDQQRRGAHLSYCVGWLRTEENNYLSIPPRVARRLPRQAQEVIGYAIHDGIPRGGGYLGMMAGQDPVELLGRGDLTNG